MKKVVLILLVVALGLLLPVAAMAQQADEWSQYQKDVTHRGSMTIDLPATNRVARRTAAINAREGSQPVVAGNKVYVYAGTAGGTSSIYCFNMSNGQQVWKTDVTAVSGNDSWSSPAVADGVVYIGSGYGVSALDAASGRQLWVKDLRTIKGTADIVNSSPAVDGNRLIIGDYGSGCYYCLDTSHSGKLLWTFSLEASCTAISTACISNGMVYLGQGAAFGAPVSPNGKVWCVNESTGKAVTGWGTGGSYTTDGKLDMAGSVTAYGDFVYFTDFTYGSAATPNCHLYCLSKNTGAEAWKMPVYGSDGAPAVTDNLVITAGQQAGAWPAPGTNWTTAFTCDTQYGRNPVQAWTKSGIGGPNMSACIGGNGTVAVGNTTTSWPTTATDLYVLKTSDGSTVLHAAEAGAAPVATAYGLLSLGQGKLITFGTGALPNGDYYFAEGCTREGYQEWICLENPTTAQITATIEYMLSDGSTRKQDVGLPKQSRTSVNVNASLGGGLDVSVHVTGNGHFVAERSMYCNAGGINGGEQVMGATDPSQHFLYAEGTTRSGFRTWLALQNPQSKDANVLITYLYGDGTPPAQQNLVVPAKSRQTVDVNAGAGAEKDVSIAISANRPVVGERVMYFQYPAPIMGSLPSGVHNCTGATAASTTWQFAEGTTRSNFQEYLCLMNPYNRETTATIQYMKATGAVQSVTRTLGPNSRTTVNVNADVGPEQDVSAVVTSRDPIVAERPMYFQFLPVGGASGMWKGGHNSIGARYSAYKWEFAEGCTREGMQTFLCIANPNGSNASVDITYYMYKASGGTETKTANVQVGANARVTILLNAAVGADRDVSASVTCSVPIVVERPMYFSFNGYTDGGVSLGLPGAP